VAAIFGPRANLVVKLALLVLAIAFVGAIGLVWGAPYTNYMTDVDFIPPQPVPFSHKHHVGDDGIDCRYCHTSVEISSNAGMPPTETCMTCHSQLWTGAPMLEPVRESLARHKNIRWSAVNTLPDYVYFDHSIHVAKGVGCTECHGPIGDMPLTWKAKTLYMSFCLACHRDPAPRLRPRAAVFDPDWHRTTETPSGNELMREYQIHSAKSLTDCSVCHR
jgi:hypothetical protein